MKRNGEFGLKKIRILRYLIEQFFREINGSRNVSVYVNYDKETSVTLLE